LIGLYGALSTILAVCDPKYTIPGIHSFLVANIFVVAGNPSYAVTCSTLARGTCFS